MAEMVATPTKTFTSGTTLVQHARVYLSAGTVIVADASTVEIGTTENAALVSGDPVAVRLRTAQGTQKMLATAVAITAGNPVYAAAAGYVASAGTVYCGTAMNTTTGTAGDIVEVLPGPNTDLSAALATTTAATFTVDSDAATPKIALSGQAAGSGDFTTTLKPEATLSASTYVIVPETANGDTLVAVALAQTLTSKTLTSPVLTTPQINDTSADHQYVFAVSELAADRIVTLPLLTGGDTFVFQAHTQTLTNKTLTAPTIGGATTFAEEATIVAGTVSGLTYATAASQKQGFWGATPIVQPSGSGQATSGAMTLTGANTGTSGTGLNLFDETWNATSAAYVMADFMALKEDIVAANTLLIAVRLALVNAGLIKGSA